MPIPSLAVLMMAMLLWLCSALSARAQGLPYQVFNQDQGLTEPTVTCITHAASGFMLVGTYRGVFVFDGKRFTSLGPAQGLPDGAFIIDIVVMKSDVIVVRYADSIYVSERGVSAGVMPQALRFHRAANHTGVVVFGADEVFTVSNDQVLFVHNGRMFSLRRSDAPGAAEIVPYPLETGDAEDGPGKAAIRRIFDSRGQFWIAISDGRVCRLSGHSAHCLGKRDGLPQEDWLALATDSDGRISLRSAALIASLGRPAAEGTAGPRLAGEITVSDLPEQGDGHTFSYGFRTIFLFSAAGNLITQADHGLIMRSHGLWQSVRELDRLPPAPVSAALFDPEGDLWVATYGYGIFKTRGYGVWQNIDRQDGLSSNFVWQIERQPGGPLWVATDDGVDAIDASEAGPPVRVRHLPAPAFSLAFAQDGALWRSFGRDGVVRIDLATGATIHYSLPPANQMLPSGTHGMWLLTQDGLYRIDDVRASWQPPRLIGLSGAIVVSGAEMPDGAMLLVANGQLIRRTPDGAFETMVEHWPKAGFTPSTVALGHDGSIWIGGDGGGVYRLRARGGRVGAIELVNTSRILSDNVFSLLIDRRGWLWVGSSLGLSVFDGHCWISLTTSDGLIWNDIGEKGLYEDQDGSIWIATSHGLSHLLRPATVFDRQSLQPVISALTLGARLMPDRAVPFSREPFAAQFGVLNFRAATATRFRYRMEGVDRGWAETAIGEARYPVMPFGHHVFTVVAYDPLTHQVSKPVSILLRMRKPWWLWWPLLVLYAAAFMAAVCGLLALRDRYLLRRQRLLQTEVDRQTREIRAAQSALLRQATQDSLTGLLTRGEIQRQLVAVLAEANEAPGMVVALLDIDHFKRINDRFGHLIGDEVLRELGLRLKGLLRATEYAGRYGGEEILIVLQDAERAGEGRLEILNAAIRRKPFLIEGEAIAVTCSMGVATVQPEDSWKTLIGRADAALYHAKATGRDRVVHAEMLPPAANIVPRSVARG